MPTLLVTRKMSPELAARVRASVRGHRAAPGARVWPRSVSLIRLAVLLTIIGASSALVVSLHRRERNFEVERAALASRVHRESASLKTAEKAFNTRVESWLASNSGPYSGDFTTGTLGVTQTLRDILARPTVYVRGPVQSFATAAGVVRAAAGSAKDAFLLCLEDPPSARSEKVLLARTRSAYAGGERMHHSTSHVERLQYATLGLPFLAPDWEARVLVSEEPAELDRLRRAFDRAPIAAAKRAAKAELLLFAMDEPGDPRTPMDLDGERAHSVRVGLVDLVTTTLVFRLRRAVDPSWLSPSARAEHASGVDGCALAFDVHAALTPATAEVTARH